MEPRAQHHPPEPGDRLQAGLPQDTAHRARNGRFINPWPGAAPHRLREFLRWTLTDRRRNRSGQSGELNPDRGQRRERTTVERTTFPLVAPDFPDRAAAGEIVMTWVGHSSFLLQMDGINILLDPVWGERASPVSFAGPRRHVPPGVRFESLPPVDVIIISHDHYDHLDRYTVGRLVREHSSAVWVAPLGVGAWLARRGAAVAAELDWWSAATVRGLLVSCTPAQHFSGRRLTGRNATVWCGWAIRSGSAAVLFAGDTGLHPEFGEITRRFGPFDAAFMPIGAYAPRWFMRPVHMSPDEAVAAYREIVRANGGRPVTFVAMHWGTFRLTDEPMDEPPALARAAWYAAGLDPELLWVARHGETRRITGPDSSATGSTG